MENIQFGRQSKIVWVRMLVVQSGFSHENGWANHIQGYDSMAEPSNFGLTYQSLANL